DRPAAGEELAVDDLRHEQPAGGGDLVVGQVLRLAGVQPETASDEQQDERAEQEAALALQAGLAEEAFEGAVGHGWWSVCLLTVRTVVRRPAADADELDGATAARARFALAAIDAKLILVAACQTAAADVVADRRAALLDGPVEDGGD